MSSVALNKSTLTAEKFEAYMVGIARQIVRFRQVEKSAELHELMALEPIVCAPEFQANKDTLLHRKYKDTEEGKTMSRYNHARRSIITAKYLAIEKTTQFKNWALVKSLQQWRADKQVVRDYFELNPVVNDPDFQKRNAFWADKNRWYTTPESKQDSRYQELLKHPEIVFYKSLTAEQVAEWERYSILFADSMEGKSAWTAGYYYTNKALKAVHSQIDELQANNGGQNVIQKDSVLRLEVKKETAKTSVWDPKKGFVPAEKEYTGDVIHMGNAFVGSEGLFMIKARVSGKAHQAVYLSAGEKQPLIVLGQYAGAKEIKAGVVTDKGQEMVSVTGMKSNTWYVLTAAISKTEIVWYVQDQEILRVKNTLGNRTYTPVMAAYLPANAKPSTGMMEIDWIKILGKK